LKNFKLNKNTYYLAITLGILVSILIGFDTYKKNTIRLEKEIVRFESLSKSIVSSIDNKMEAYRQVLYGVKGLFEVSSSSVTREQFRTYIQKLSLVKYYPGIQGIGYSVVIKGENLKQHIEEMRDKGFKNYDVFPKGKRDMYTSIIYLEPFDKRNQRAFGYDMYSQETRQKAMRRAIETTLPALSSKVKLVQENGIDEQAGFLLYTPLYHKDMPIETKEQRYKAIKGFVYAVFRTKDFLLKTISSSLNIVDVTMYAKSIDKSNVLYSSNEEECSNKKFHKIIEVDVDGNRWFFEIDRKDDYKPIRENINAWIFIILGFLLTYMVSRILKRYMEDQELKDDVLLNISDGVMIANHKGKVIYTNKGFEEITGYTKEYMFEQNANILYGKDTDRYTVELNTSKLETHQPFEYEALLYKKDKTNFWAGVSVTPICKNGKLKRYISIINDITKRKIAEKNTYFEKALLENILNNTNAVVALIDINGVMVRLNEFGKKFVGYTQEEISSEPYFWQRFIPRASIDDVTTVILKAKDGELVEKKQNSWISKDGEERIFEWSNKLICDHDGKVEYLITVGIDVTQEVFIQKNQKKFRKQLELAAEISGMAFWELDLKTKTFKLNDLYYKFLDTDAQSEGGYFMDIETNFKKFLPSKSQQIVLDAFEKIKQKSEDFVSSFEYEMHTRTGRVKQVLVNYVISYDENKQPSLAYGTKYDLTEMKHKEQELLELNKVNSELLDEQKTLLSLFDKGDSLLFKWRNDPSWSVEYVSGSVNKFLGYTKEDFLSSNIMYSDTIYGDDLKQVMEEVNEEVETKSDFFIHKPYRVVTKDGIIKWVLDYTVTQKDEHGEITHFIGYIVDITLLKQKEHELEIAKEHADESNKAKSEFLANMSHEIRTPLNGIIGLTELVLKTDLNPHQIDYLRKSVNSSKALLQIINDVLDYSKIEANKIEIESIDFKLDSMLYELSELFTYKANESDILFSCEISPNAHNVLVGDPFRIKQVLTNLIGNALKFTKKGTISIYVELVSMEDHKCRLIFSVIDTGIGISQKKQNKLFRSFSQVDASNTREYGGTGLGLSISKKLVELMGGEIGVVSKEGEGSEFYFTVNLQYKSPDRFLTKHNLENDNVLVICNSEKIGINFKEKVERLGVKSVKLRGFDEAINYLKEFKVEHIIVYFLSDEIDELRYVHKLDSIKQGAKVIVSAKYANRLEIETNILKHKLDVKAAVYKPLTASSIYDALTGSEDELETITHDTQNFKTSGYALLVEDNEINQLVAQQNLENYGLRVDIANDGLEGVQKASENDYDIIFMDLQMPNMDGFEAAKKIRETDTATPIVALSAAVMEKDKELTKEAGMEEHLAKPIDLTQLQNILKKYFEADEKVDIEKQVQKGKSSIYKIDGIDIDELLERVIYNEDIAKKLLIQFYDQYNDTPQKLQKSDLDSKEFDNMMHALKGVSGNLSMTKLYELSKAVYENKDKSFREENMAELIKLTQEILDELSMLKDDNKKENNKIFEKEQSLETIDFYIDKLSNASFMNDKELEELYECLGTFVDLETQNSLKGEIDLFDYKTAKDTLEKIKKTYFV